MPARSRDSSPKDREGRSAPLPPGPFTFLLLCVALHFLLLALTLNRNLDLLFNDAAYRSGPGTDFQAYYEAGLHWRSGEGIYGHGPGFGFRYHPLFAVGVGAPLSFLDPSAAYAVWVVIQEIAFLIALLLLRRLIPGEGPFRFAAVCLVCATPYLLDVYMGNANMIVSTLLLASFAVYRRDRVRSFAALYAISLVVKPVGLVFLPLFLIHRRFAAVGFSLLAVAATALPFLLGDSEGAFRLWRLNTEGSFPAGWLLLGGSQGFAAFLLTFCARTHDVAVGGIRSLAELPGRCRILMDSLPFLFGTVSIILTWIYRKRFGVCVFVLGAAYFLGYRDVWEHSYVFLLPGLVFLYDSRLIPSRWTAVAAAGVALPTAFALYDPHAAGRLADPDHVWGLGTALFHHATKPVWVFFLYAACVWKAVRERAGSRCPAKEGSEAGTDGDAGFRLPSRALLLIFAVAFLYRGAYLADAGRMPDFHLFTMDQEYHLGWAEGIAEGDWPPPFDELEKAPYFRAPLYAWFLAGLFSFFGKQTVLFRIVQIAIGSVSAAMAGALGARILGRRVGILAGLLCALRRIISSILL